uniref:Uncharacterized protein n=1 Tax=Meloidogyne enterolobii TaxID=390850 RepID=A0A6V7V8X4_MELEN|nr:unnamed protein product [Meloidogyne enterolobii]
MLDSGICSAVILFFVYFEQKSSRIFNVDRNNDSSFLRFLTTDTWSS